MKMKEFISLSCYVGLMVIGCGINEIIKNKKKPSEDSIDRALRGEGVLVHDNITDEYFLIKRQPTQFEAVNIRILISEGKSLRNVYRQMKLI